MAWLSQMKRFEQADRILGNTLLGVIDKGWYVNVEPTVHPETTAVRSVAGTQSVRTMSCK